VVSRDGPVRIRDLLVETSGAYWDLFQVDYRDRPSFRWREECTSYPRHSFQLAVETRNRLQALAGRALRGNGLRPDGGRALVLNASPAAAWSVLVVENGNPTVDGARAHYL
jgi:3-oxoacyl-[acyl-carrier-protein] synthase-3